MKQVRLGPDGPLVPAVGQGTMGIGGYFQRADDNDAEFIRQLRLGIDLGMTVIDTAEVYGEGHAEELVGRAIADVRDQVVIMTKFSAEHAAADDVIAAAERSLKRLKVETIDVYQPHWPNVQVPLEETVAALDSLIQAGKVRWAGLSNYDAAGGAKTASLLTAGKLVCLQNEYSLAERTVENDLLPFCRSEGLTLAAYSPYQQGKLLKRSERTEALHAMAERYSVSAAQLALAWLLREPNVLVIPKAAREENLRTNAQVLGLQIAPADLDRLSAAFASSVRLVPVDRIDVVGAQDDRKVYRTLEEALQNRLGMSPSPVELSQEILGSGGKLQKPIKVCLDRASGRYQLLEGRLKYWGWVIAYGDRSSIPALEEEAQRPS